jgi:hypothetical protein
MLAFPLTLLLFYAISLAAILLPRFRPLSWAALVLWAAALCFCSYLFLRNPNSDMVSGAAFIVIVLSLAPIGVQLALQLHNPTPSAA